MAAPLTPVVIVEPFAGLYTMSTVKRVHTETLPKVVGLGQRDQSRRMNELQDSEGSVARLTHYGMSCSFPLPCKNPLRFQDVASFTKKQFVRRGLLSLIPSLTFLRPLSSPYWSPCLLSLSLALSLKLLIDMFVCPE